MSALSGDSSSSSLHATPLPTERTRKLAPRSNRLVLRYTPSPDGVDSNLLVLLHGLGDTARGFESLGWSLQKGSGGGGGGGGGGGAGGGSASTSASGPLPQTATLVVQGPTRIPILPEEAYSYWPIITPLGEMLPSNAQDPKAFIEAFGELLDELVAPGRPTEEAEEGKKAGACGWPMEAIHFLGYAHGGTAMLEGVEAWCRRRRVERKGQAQEEGEQRLGSITSVCGALLSLPTFTPPLATPMHYFFRVPSASHAPPAALDRRADVVSLRKAFAHVELDAVNSPSAGEERMPQGKEWDGVVRFWSRHWRQRGEWERGGGVYVVGRGGAASTG